jgi:hypothetical protein
MREGPQFSTRPYGADQRGQLNARNGLFVHEPPARGSLECRLPKKFPAAPRPIAHFHFVSRSPRGASPCMLAVAPLGPQQAHQGAAMRPPIVLLPTLLPRGLRSRWDPVMSVRRGPPSLPTLHFFISLFMPVVKISAGTARST